MKWAYTLKNKMKLAFLLLFVLGMVLINNLSQRGDVASLTTVVHSIYADRVIVENYIFRLSDNIHQVIELSSGNAAPGFDKIAPLFHSIDSLNSAYRQTMLTPKEDSVFSSFTALGSKIKHYSQHNETALSVKAARESLALLDTLSAIQVSETKNLLSKTNNIAHAAETSSQFEIALLIIIALVIQGLVLASRGLKTIVPENPYLN